MGRYRIFVILYNNSMKLCLTSFDEEACKYLTLSTIICRFQNLKLKIKMKVLFTRYSTPLLQVFQVGFKELVLSIKHQLENNRMYCRQIVSNSNQLQLL